MVRGTLRRVQRPSPRRTRDSRVELWATRTPLGRLRTPLGRLRTPLGRLRTPLGRLWTIRTPLGRLRTPLGHLRTPLGRLRTSRTHLGRPRFGVCRSPAGRLQDEQDPLGSTLDEQDPLGSTSGLASVGPLQVVCRTIRTHLGLLWMSRTHLGRRRLGVCRLSAKYRLERQQAAPKLTKLQTVKKRGEDSPPVTLKTTASQTVEPWIRMWRNGS